MRRLLGLIMLLAIISTARGQTAYSYRYWFDNNLATLQTEAANGETTVEVDISGLAKGSVHTLHFQGIDENGRILTSLIPLADNEKTIDLSRISIEHPI